MTINQAGRMGQGGADRAPEIIESGGTARLHLTLATTDYDHVRDLTNGVSTTPSARTAPFITSRTWS